MSNTTQNIPVSVAHNPSIPQQRRHRPPFMVAALLVAMPLSIPANPDPVFAQLRSQTAVSNVYRSDLDTEGRTTLMRAVISADINAFKSCIETELNINAQDSSGSTALMLAVLHNNYDFVSLLLKKGTDPNIAYNKGFTALHVILPIKIVFSSNSLLENDNRTLLNLCSRAFNTRNKIIAELLNNGADVNTLWIHPPPPLMVLVDYMSTATTLIPGSSTIIYQKNIEALRILLSHGADVNAAYGDALKIAAS